MICEGENNQMKQRVLHPGRWGLGVGPGKAEAVLAQCHRNQGTRKRKLSQGIDRSRGFIVKCNRKTGQLLCAVRPKGSSIWKWEIKICCLYSSRHDPSEGIMDK